jgi:FG-GAP-like repeat
MITDVPDRLRRSPDPKPRRRAAPEFVRAAAAALAIATLGAAQAPPFQVLDTPIPPTAYFADALADLDGDGDLDLLASPGLFAIGAYLNDGAGRFTALSLGTLAFYRTRTVVADLDGNGFQDILSINVSMGVRLDVNLGSLNFIGPVGGLPPLAGINGTFARNLAVADVDLDGDVDVLVGTSGGPLGSHGIPVLWLNNAGTALVPATSATFPAPGLQSQFLFLRDVDGNGYPDAIFAGPYTAPTISIATNTGGVFTFGAMQWTIGITSLDVGDFDADGRPDLVVANATTTTVIMNSATGFLPPVATGPPARRVSAVDVNGDGADELLVQAYNGTGLTLHAVAPGGAVGPALQSWPTLTSLWPTPLLNAHATGAEWIRDLDGDGDRDALVVDGPPTVPVPAVLMNDATSGFVRIGGHAQGVAIGTPRIADVNGDGRPDVLGLSPYAASTVATGLNDGEGNFVPGPSTTLPLPVSSATWAYYSLYPFDRDGDGDSDLYAASNVYTSLSGAPYDVVFDNAGGTFTTFATVTGAGSTSAFRAVDIDLDGDQDLFLGRRNGTSYTNAIAGPMLFIQNLGPAGLAPPVAIGTSHATFALELGDFDGDGTIDVFQANAGGPADPCYVYLSSPGGTLTPVALGFSASYAAAGDLTNDGLADLVADGHVYYSAGGGAFVQGPALPLSIQSPPSLADVDQDGDLDLVLTPATVLLNLGNGAFSPPVSTLPFSAIPPTGSDVARTIVVDVDADGDRDLVAPGPMVVSNMLRQLAHGLWPRPGRLATIDLYGTPNGAWYLFASNGIASFPFPPFGNVLIDPASAVLVQQGTFAGPTAPSPGTFVFGGTLPNNPALVGWTSYWQLVDATTSKVTNRLTAVVLNY